MLTLQPPSQPSTSASSPQLSPMSGSDAAFPAASLIPVESTTPAVPPSRGHSSHYHRRSHRHHVTTDGRYDDDCGIPRHSEWDLYLTAQQSRHQLLADMHQQKGPASFAPPRPTPPHATIPPSALLSTDPSNFTPLAASVLQLAKQYSLPSTLDLSIPTPEPLSAPASRGAGGASRGSGLVDDDVSGAMENRRASMARLTRGLRVRESVDLSGRVKELSEPRHAGQGVGGERSERREEQKEELQDDDAEEPHEHRDETFLTSIADTDSHRATAAWTECNDVHTAISRLPSCLHSTPPVPASLSFPRLLSLSPAVATLPSVVQPLLLSEPCLALLHHSLYFCLLLLCGSGDDELDRFVAWQSAKRRADAAAEAKATAAQPAGARAPSTAAGARKRRGKGREKEAVTRYTYYGEDEQHLHTDASNERLDAAATAAEDDEEEALKPDKRALDDVPRFFPSRTPLSGPAGLSSLSLASSSHPRAAELSALLQRMSDWYLRLFLLPRPQHVDAFLSHLPAVVADTLHASYLALFPASMPLLHCSLFVERLRETLQALLAGWVATARQHTLTLPDIRRQARKYGEEKEEMARGGEERTCGVPIFLQRRRASLGTSPLIAHFLSSHSIHTPASLSLSLPLSFPVQLSPAELAALAHHQPPPAAATRSSAQSAASLHMQYAAMRAAVAAGERADRVAAEEAAGREAEARRVALRAREEFARVLVRESQQSKYKQLKMNAKQIALRRLSQWNGQSASRESE